MNLEESRHPGHACEGVHVYAHDSFGAGLLGESVKVIKCLRARIVQTGDG